MVPKLVVKDKGWTSTPNVARDGVQEDSRPVGQSSKIVFGKRQHERASELVNLCCSSSGKCQLTKT